MREVVAYILENKRTILCHNVGFALLTLSSYGDSAWAPTYFIRNHGWTASRIGIVYGPLYCIFGVLGVVAGGRFSGWLGERGYRDASLRVALIAYLFIMNLIGLDLGPTAVALMTDYVFRDDRAVN